MTEDVQFAYVSGQLRRAIFVAQDRSMTLGLGEGGGAREAGPNELTFFFSPGVEFEAVEPPAGGKLSLAHIERALERKTAEADALYAVLGGMDRRFSLKTQRGLISCADKMMADPDVEAAVKNRVLGVAPPPNLEPGAALEAAREICAERAARIYDVLAAGGPERVKSLFWEVADALNLAGSEEAAVATALAEAGAFARLAEIMVLSDDLQSPLKAMEIAMKGQEQISIVARRALFAMLRTLQGGPVEAPPQDDDDLQQSDGASEGERRGADWRRRGWASAADIGQLSRVQNEIKWIVGQLSHERQERALYALDRLVSRQMKIGRPGDLVKTLTNVADRAADLGRFEFAERCLDLARRQPVDDPVLHGSRARILGLCGEHLNALAVFDEIIARFPNDAAARCGRAEMLRQTGRLEDALEQYARAAGQFPGSAVARNGKAETLRQIGRLDEALAEYEGVIDFFPEDAIALSGRAETVAQMGRLAEALKLYDEAIARFPRDAAARCGRAETLLRMGRLDAAIAQYREVVEQFPHNPRARIGLARLHVLGGAYALTRELIPESAGPRSLADWIGERVLALADLREGNVEQAAARLSKGVRECPFAAQRHYFTTALAVALLRVARDDAAQAQAAEEHLAHAASEAKTPCQQSVVLMLSAHLAGVREERVEAERYIRMARNFTTGEHAIKQRLECELTRRFQLFEDAPRQLSRTETELLDDAVLASEICFIAA